MLKDISLICVGNWLNVLFHQEFHGTARVLIDNEDNMQKQIVFLCFSTTKLLLLSTKVNKWSQKYKKIWLYRGVEICQVWPCDYSAWDRAIWSHKVRFRKWYGLKNFVLCPARQTQLFAYIVNSSPFSIRDPLAKCLHAQLVRVAM